MDFSLPEIGEGLYEAELVRWLVKPGDSVKRGQVLLEVLTDKATMEVPSPFAGTISELRAEEGSQLKVGDVVLTYSGAGEAAPAKSAPAKKSEGKAAAKEPAHRTESKPKITDEVARKPAAMPVSASSGNGPAVPVKAAPSVRYMARKLGIDISRVRGTGPQGRILVEDLASEVGPAQGGKAESRREPKPDYGKPGTRIKLQGLRRIIAERMVQSKKTIPHYSYMDECDVTEMVHLREGLRDAAAKIGVKVTYLAFFVKAVAAALKEVPLVNSTLDEESGEIVLHDRYNIGVAVAAPAGLIVPVVKDADKKDLIQIARDIERLSAEARAGKAKLDDLKGGTFTVTSIGGIGGLLSTPIINHPEVGILGIGKVVKRPVYDGTGIIKPADIVYLSFSFDHRVLDGAIGAAFGNAVMEQLKNPAGLFVAG